MGRRRMSRKGAGQGEQQEKELTERRVQALERRYLRVAESCIAGSCVADIYIAGCYC